MQTVFGIDFGTTNSALSIYRDGKVEIADIDAFNGNASLMRSVLYFNEDEEIFTGQEAIDNYVSDGAAGRFMQSIKNFLPNRSFEGTEVFGKKYLIEDLVAIILKKIKAQGEAWVGSPVDSVVLGRPVVFSEDPEKDALAQSRLEKAARKAGFRNIFFQFEPVAAALSYEESLPAGAEKLVLIGDFGGGTSDFTVIRVKGGAFGRSDRRSDVLSLGGVYTAGDKFDSQIMWEKIAKYFGRGVKYKGMGKDEEFDIPHSIIYTLCQWHRIPLLRARKTREQIRLIKNAATDRKAIENLEHLIGDNFGFFLFRCIEKAKCELSQADLTEVVFRERDLSITEAVSREEFETMNAGNVARIAGCIDEVVANSGITHGGIDTVFLTGGTSRIPFIRRLFEERFGADKLENRNAFTSVVHGLGASVPLFT
ncbi:Hsp70 family protein [Geomesophilobacter sediminis]|uniref:Hsp70 family protein n=1 Tax=Geomesophilobacter sediminis TaxID=2798584 RepID=A0A8J7IY74_9BACT|nr:Hsp70 family protein [Geomesophilobacter sediminis]MBJ6725057.1 Hsp70 family protein [Geomesophilobacter sediminis]